MNPPPAKTRHSVVAGFFSNRVNDLTPNPPPRHGNQQVRVSAKTARLLKLYEDDLRVRYGARTCETYRAEVGVFLRWLSECGLGLAETRAQDLQAYQSALYAARKPDGKPYSTSSHYVRLTALKNLFRFLHRRGYVLSNPAAAIDLPHKEKRLPRTILTPGEARRTLDAADEATPTGLRDRAILETFYATGIRVTELANLAPADVDTEERTLRVVQGKGRKDRAVPLTAAASAAIEAYLATGRPKLVPAAGAPWLFLSDRGGWLHRWRLNWLVRRWATKAGVKKHVTCHTFRHSVATHLLKGRADIRHIQMLLGHASLQTTERYTRVELSDLRAVLRRAHPPGRWCGPVPRRSSGRTSRACACEAMPRPPWKQPSTWCRVSSPT